MGFTQGVAAGPRGLFLPRALLMPIGLKALAALVLRHFQTTFLFQIAHGD